MMAIVLFHLSVSFFLSFKINWKVFITFINRLLILLSIAIACLLNGSIFGEEKWSINYWNEIKKIFQISNFDNVLRKAIILEHNSIKQYDFFWFKIAKCTQSFKRLNSKSAGKRLAVKGNRYVNFEPANNYSINDNGIFNCFYPHIIIYTLNNMLLNG